MPSPWLWLWLQWFPMRDASAGGAPNRSQSLVALDVLLRVLWMPGDGYCAKFVVGPDCPKTSAFGRAAHSLQRPVHEQAEPESFVLGGCNHNVP